MTSYKNNYKYFAKRLHFELSEQIYGLYSFLANNHIQPLKM